MPWSALEIERFETYRDRLFEVASKSAWSEPAVSVVQIEALAELLVDRDRAGPADMRTCLECAHYSSWAYCPLARAGKVPDLSRRFEPITDRLHRCAGFSPRWPDLLGEPGPH